MLQRIALVFVIFSAACSPFKSDLKNLNRTESGTHEAALLTSTRTLTVISRNGIALTGAKVLIGHSLSLPQGKVLATDANGRFALPQSWQASEPITIDAPGHIRATFWGLSNRQSHLVLNPADGAKKIELSGITTGYPSLEKDGWIDFSLLMPSLSREELFGFDMSLVLSSEVDHISVAGQDLSLPSNLSLPQQTETYIIPIKFNKPLYRIYFRDPGVYRVTCSHARFPFKTVVKELRAGKSFYDVINHFQFKGSTARNVTAVNNSQLDFKINERLFNSRVQVQAPQFNSDLGMVVIALDENNGLLDTTDIKNFASGQTMDLSILNQSSVKLLAVLQPKEAQKLNTGHEMSIIYNEGAGKLPQFIDFAPAPLYQGDQLILKPPQSPRTVEPAGSYFALSDIESIETPDYRYERKFRKWEFYVSNWPQDLDIPQFPDPIEQKFKLRWEVNFLGNKNSQQSVDLGPQMLESSSHASRNVLDL